MRLAQIYFDHCFQLFLEREREIGSVKRFIRIGDKFTICFRSAATSDFDRVLRPFAHLSTSKPSDNAEEPDLTLCVWDSQQTSKAVPPRPSWDERVRKHESIDGGNYRIFGEIDPDTLSLLDINRRIGMFWINDFSELPWLDAAHPFSVLFGWWAKSCGLLLLHAGCVGTPDGGALIIGEGGTGKSTLCLSSISENLSYAADDYCLAGTEAGAPVVYSLYNTAMLSPIDQIPRIEDYKLERTDATNEHFPYKQPVSKAIFSVHENRPDMVVARIPISSIVLVEPMEASESLIEPISSKDAISALASSMSQVMKIIGFSAIEFLALHQIFAGVPCYKLYRNVVLSASASEIAKLLKRVEHDDILDCQPDRRVLIPDATFGEK